MNCKYLKIRTKNYNKYIYCSNPNLKKEINFKQCKNCKYKDYKPIKELKKKSKNLKKLEDKGYVVKKKAKEDKRKFYITLTKKAEKVINVHKEYHENMIDMITRNLSKKEEEGLVDLLSKIKYFFS